VGLKSFVQKIKGEVNIVDLISSYIELQKSGRNYKALCPFHQEKTPSFYIYENTQSYHCFGCGASGDIFSFVQNHQNIDFIDAVKFIAHKYSLPMPDIENNKDPEFIQYTNDMKKLELFFMNNLSKKSPAWDYLKNKRAIDPDSLKELGVGWSAYEDSKGLLDILDPERLKELGIFNDRANNIFSNRLMFSLHDRDGNVIGFSGRGLDEEQKPKYINSPQTKYFNKSSVLYLYDKAKASIREVDFVIITEGYFDAIRLFINGIKNTVAIMGTSLSKDHMKEISRYTNKFVFALDSDQAGQTAIEKSFQNLDKNINALVLNLSPVKDPDDYVQKFGIESFQNTLLKAISMEEFLLNILRKRFNLEKETGRDSLISNSRAILARAKRMGNISRFDKLISKLSDWTNLDKKLLLESWNADRRNSPGQIPLGQNPQRKQKRTEFKNLDPEEELTVLYLFHPTTRLKIERLFQEYADTVKDSYARFFLNVREQFNPDDAADYLQDYFTTDKIEGFFRQFERYDKVDSFPNIIDDCEKALKKRELKNKMMEIDRLIESSQEIKDKLTLISNRLQLSKEINQLNMNEGRAINERE